MYVEMRINTETYFARVSQMIHPVHLLAGDAQLLEGIDWRRPLRPWQPERAA